MAMARRGAGGGTGAALAKRPEWVGVAGNQAFVQDKGNQSMIHITASAQDHVNAYLGTLKAQSATSSCSSSSDVITEMSTDSISLRCLTSLPLCSEYDRIVGDADGGKLFSPEEYEEFKANAIAHRANRIYVVWRNMQTGMDCRSVGPSSPCFCGHRYKNHATDNHNKKIFCKQAGCPCTLYDYIPIRGTQDVKCSACRHSYDTHNVTGKRKCKQGGCSCTGFHTSLSCSCKDQYGAHQTVFETREERQAAGRPVDNLAGGGQGYEALGGLTSFSSLVDGIDRMAIGPGGETPELVGAPPGWDAGEQRRLGPGAASASSSSSALPAKKQLTQEDEFALYDAKYKKGGSAYSSVSRASNLPATLAARKAAAQAAQQGPPAGAPSQREDMGQGGRAHELFHTPHQLSSHAEPAPRGRIGAGSSSSSAVSTGVRRPAAAAAASSAPRAAAGTRASVGRAPPAGRGGYDDDEQLRDRY
jgi:hypothetical protein